VELTQLLTNASKWKEEITREEFAARFHFIHNSLIHLLASTPSLPLSISFVCLFVIDSVKYMLSNEIIFENYVQKRDDTLSRRDN
jgi:hypothetical protein